MPNRSPSTADRRYQTRRTHLHRLWAEWIAAEPLPQLDRWIAARLRRERSYGKNDRAWYADALFGMARYAVTAAAVKRCLQSVEGPCLAAVRDIPAAAVADTALARMSAESTGAPGTDPDGSEDAVGEMERYGLPPGCLPRLNRRVALSRWTQAQREAFLKAHESRPPLWLRVQKQESTEDIAEELRATGFTVTSAPGVLAIRGDRPIYTLPCYREGRVEVQDAASQAIGRALEPRPGEFVWDCCAGGGGKTLQLASMMNNTGAVYASDVRRYKLDEIRKRAARAGFRCIRCIEWDATRPPEFGAALSRHGGFDRILVDAPCSGSGTWRRNPDGKLRFHPGQLPALTDMQRHILASALNAVRRGGRVVYATCSWLAEENEDVVAAVCRELPAAQLQHMTLHGSPDLDSDTTFTATIKRQDQ